MPSRQTTFTTSADPVQVRAFFLSEGDRQELELHGFTNINGRRMTTAEVRAELAKSETQKGVTIADAATGE
jgi:hypothetical protein